MARRTIGDSSSSRTAEQFRMAAWATYTPSWTTSGSAPSLGNGTLVGSYRREGTTLHLRGRLAVGSTSAGGTGDLRMSLPSGMAVTTEQALAAFWYDASAATLYPGVAIADTSSSYTTFQFIATGTRAGSGGLGNGDVVTWTGTIEINP